MVVKDGGSAFPHPRQSILIDEPTDAKIMEAKEILADQGGMSLRDWFAGVTLQGIMANGEWKPNDPKLGMEASYAQQAYHCADAMLAERKK